MRTNRYSHALAKFIKFCTSLFFTKGISVILGINILEKLATPKPNNLGQKWYGSWDSNPGPSV